MCGSGDLIRVRGRRNQPAPKCTGPILHLWAQKLFTNQNLTKTIKHLDITPGQLLMMQEVTEHSFPKMMLIMMMTVMTTTTTTMVMQKWSGLCFLICCTSIQALGNAITKKLMQTTISLQSYTFANSKIARSTLQKGFQLSTILCGTNGCCGSNMSTKNMSNKRAMFAERN